MTDETDVFMASLRESLEHMPPIFKERINPHLGDGCTWDVGPEDSLLCLTHQLVILPPPEVMFAVVGMVDEGQMDKAQRALDAVWDTPQGQAFLDQKWKEVLNEPGGDQRETDP